MSEATRRTGVMVVAVALMTSVFLTACSGSEPSSENQTHPLEAKDPAMDPTPPSGNWARSQSAPNDSLGYDISNENVEPGNVIMKVYEITLDPSTCEFVATVAVKAPAVHEVTVTFSAIGDGLQATSPEHTLQVNPDTDKAVAELPLGIHNDHVHPKDILHVRGQVVVTSPPAVTPSEQKYDDVPGGTITRELDTACL